MAAVPSTEFLLPGVVVRMLTARWFDRADADWLRLFREHAKPVENQPEADPHTWYLAFGEPPSPAGVGVAVSVFEGTNAGRIACSITVSPGVAPSQSDAWLVPLLDAASAEAPVATYEVRVGVDANHLTTIVPRDPTPALDGAVSELGERVRVVGIVYDIENGAAGLRRVELASQTKGYEVGVHGRASLKIAGPWILPAALDLTEQVVKRLFKTAERGT